MFLVLRASADLRQTSIKEEFRIVANDMLVYHQFTSPLSEKIIDSAYKKAENKLCDRVLNALETMGEIKYEFSDEEADKMWGLIRANSLKIEIDHIMDATNMKKYELETSTFQPSPGWTSTFTYIGVAGAVALVWIFRDSIKKLV